MHWCYIDESWRDGKGEKIGVLAATVGSASDFQKLDNFMFKMRRKYLGEENARDRSSELKGKQLMANNSFKMQDLHKYSKNLALVREVLEFVKTTSIHYVGVTVYGTKQPSLLAPSAKSLARPFKELCIRLNAAIPKNQRGLMVFDQRVGAQEGISIAITNYLAGMSEKNALHPYPLVGVSNIHAGLQLADLAAFILAKWAEGDERFKRFYCFLQSSQVNVQPSDSHRLYGLARLQHEEGEKFIVRKKRFLP